MAKCVQSFTAAVTNVPVNVNVLPFHEYRTETVALAKINLEPAVAVNPYELTLAGRIWNRSAESRLTFK